MRVFLAGLCHETSTFSPIPTTRESFESFVAHRPKEGKPDERCMELAGYGAFARAALADGHEVIASSFLWAQPSAPCVRSDYETLRDEILGHLERSPDIGMVLLFLHGAQVAQGIDDCEGDFLARVRTIVGPRVFVGALLDLHANVTEQMVREASALVACRLYPHTDFDERAVELYRLGVAAVRNKLRPAMHFERIPMIGMFYTTEPQMAEANRAARELESRPGILSVSLIHGFLWADIPEMGSGVLVVSDGARSSVVEEARAVAGLFFAARTETRALRRTIDEILDEIERAGPDDAHRPYIIADCCDNAGGGAGSDSTFILEAILSRGLRNYALGLLWDPIATQFASNAGVGAKLNLRVGGKTGPYAGQPIDVQAEVLAAGRDMKQLGIGLEQPTGLNVALGIEGNLLVINDVRGQVFSPSCFTDLGIDLSAQRAVVVKSTQHFRDQFAPLARGIYYCETPGSLRLDIDPSAYRHLRRPLWPLDEVAYEPGERS